MTENEQKEPPEYLPTCKFNPPYCSAFWTEKDWRRTIALQCPCPMHKEWREKRNLEARKAT